jgi:hypothetical protein
MTLQKKRKTKQQQQREGEEEEEDLTSVGNVTCQKCLAWTQKTQALGRV